MKNKPFGTAEHTKQMLNIQRNNDIERLRKHALWLLEQNAALSQRGPNGPDNYRIEVWGGWKTELEWIELESGTKDYCLGVYDTVRDYGWKQIACGDWVVYPEEWYGLSAILSPKEKEKEIVVEAEFMQDG